MDHARRSIFLWQETEGIWSDIQRTVLGGEFQDAVCDDRIPTDPAVIKHHPSPILQADNAGHTRPP